MAGTIDVGDLPVNTKGWPDFATHDDIQDSDLFMSRRGTGTETLTGSGLKEVLSDYSAKGNFCVDSGVANAYVLEPSSGYSRVSSLQDGMRFYGRTSNSNSGATTVNVHNTGVKSVVDKEGNALSGNEIINNLELEYNLSNDEFILLNDESYPHFIIQETNASTGTFVTTGTGYRQRRFNTVVENNIDGASLSSFEITLPAGKYLWQGYFGYHAVNNSFEHIYNVTDAQYESALRGSTAGTNNSSFLEGIIDIDSQKVFSSYGYLSDSGNTGLDGTPVGIDNIYAYLKITKLS